MNLTLITDRVNKLLAGEILQYDELTLHLDSAIDDINHALNSLFPAFSEFTSANFIDRYPDYNFFPEQYIRNVVCLGAAYYFYLTDEEGAKVAQKFEEKFRNNLFLMQRDYTNKVPVDYQATEQGYVESELNYAETLDSLTEGDGSKSMQELGLQPAYYLNGDPF